MCYCFSWGRITFFPCCAWWRYFIRVSTLIMVGWFLLKYKIFCLSELLFIGWVSKKRNKEIEMGPRSFRRFLQIFPFVTPYLNGPWKLNLEITIKSRSKKFCSNWEVATWCRGTSFVFTPWESWERYLNVESPEYFCLKPFPKQSLIMVLS